MLKDIIENEIEYEKRLLDKVLGKLDGLAFMSLVASEDKKGRMRFFYYDRTLRKRKYIKDSEKNLLRDITTARFLGRRRAILQGNIMSLTEALKSLNEYDSQTIIDALPKAYKLSISKLNLNFDSATAAVIQSENPFHRELLKIPVSNGLKVRTKGELAISEELLSFDVDFQYEKALKLQLRHVRPDGSVWTETVVKYPDFTIFLKNGKVIYWEHCGMFDNPKYRADQYDKFSLYYDNDIYLNHNLIITMEDNDKPFDINVIRRIIKTMILPYT